MLSAGARAGLPRALGLPEARRGSPGDPQQRRRFAAGGGGEHAADEPDGAEAWGHGGARPGR